ncbi:MAG TPA: lactate utilization protein [Stellaceae bacterium]
MSGDGSNSGGGSSSARDQILGGIRRSLRRGPLGEAEAGALAARLAAPPRNTIPARAAALDDAGKLDLFVKQAEGVQATVHRVASLDDVPEAVTAYLAANNLPSEVVMAPDPALDPIPWADRPLLQISRGRPALASDAVSVTSCFAAVAETGTLMLASGAEHPSTLNFLPDTHVVVVRADQVVGSYEDAWTKLREQRPGAMPRTVNFVTGPSRTGDIELRLQLGAHGPRRLHLVVVDPAAETADAAVKPPPRQQAKRRNRKSDTAAGDGGTE